MGLFSFLKGKKKNKKAKASSKKGLGGQAQGLGTTQNAQQVGAVLRTAQLGAQQGTTVVSAPQQGGTGGGWVRGTQQTQQGGITLGTGRSKPTTTSSSSPSTTSTGGSGNNYLQPVNQYTTGYGDNYNNQGDSSSSSNYLRRSGSDNSNYNNQSGTGGNKYLSSSDNYQNQGGTGGNKYLSSSDNDDNKSNYLRGGDHGGHQVPDPYDYDDDEISDDDDELPPTQVAPKGGLATKGMKDHYKGEDKDAGHFRLTGMAQGDLDREAVSEGKKSSPIIDHTQTRYFDQHEQKDHEISFDKGRLLDGQGWDMDTTQAKGIGTQFYAGAGKHIFVMTPDGKMRAVDPWEAKRIVATQQGQLTDKDDKKQYKKGKYGLHSTMQYVNHSSLVGGGDVAGAGELTVHDGQLQQVSDYSGHYQPTNKMTSQTLDHLEKNNVNLDQVGVKLINKESNVNKPMITSTQEFRHWERQAGKKGLTDDNAPEQLMRNYKHDFKQELLSKVKPVEGIAETEQTRLLREGKEKQLLAQGQNDKDALKKLVRPEANYKPKKPEPVPVPQQMDNAYVDNSGQRLPEEQQGSFMKLPQKVAPVLDEAYVDNSGQRLPEEQQGHLKKQPQKVAPVLDEAYVDDSGQRLPEEQQGSLRSTPMNKYLQDSNSSTNYHPNDPLRGGDQPTNYFSENYHDENSSGNSYLSENYRNDGSSAKKYVTVGGNRYTTGG